jgi:hypothetical protein
MRTGHLRNCALTASAAPSALWQPRLAPPKQRNISHWFDARQMKALCSLEMDFIGRSRALHN